MIDRDNKNNILSIQSNDHKTEAVLESDSFITYKYDDIIIDNSFIGFEELIPLPTSSNEINNEDEILNLSASVDILKYELEMLKKNYNDVYNNMKLQLDLIINSRTTQLMTIENELLINQLKEEVSSLMSLTDSLIYNYTNPDDAQDIQTDTNITTSSNTLE